MAVKGFVRLRELAEMYADAGALGWARFWAGLHRKIVHVGPAFGPGDDLMGPRG